MDSPVARIDLRDYLAGQALAGILASYSNPGAVMLPEPDDAAAWAYDFADALMARRSMPHARKDVDG